jgi:hypothetical protein
MATALATAACSSPTQSNTGTDDAGIDGESCHASFLGDPARPPEFDIQALRADDTIVAVQDGGTVPMLLPPQGGRVIFVGVRATNVDGCALQLTGALRDLATGSVMVDSRTINLIPTGDGWGASATSTQSISAAIASFSNVPACPNQWSSSDLYGSPYGLEVTILDRRKRQLTKKIQVLPTCAQAENSAECKCLCKAGYVLGQTCGDAGSESGP